MVNGSDDLPSEFILAPDIPDEAYYQSLPLLCDTIQINLAQTRLVDDITALRVEKVALDILLYDGVAVTPAQAGFLVTIDLKHANGNYVLANLLAIVAEVREIDAASPSVIVTPQGVLARFVQVKVNLSNKEKRDSARFVDVQEQIAGRANAHRLGIELDTYLKMLKRLDGGEC